MLFAKPYFSSSLGYVNSLLVLLLFLLPLFICWLVGGWVVVALLHIIKKLFLLSCLISFRSLMLVSLLLVVDNYWLPLLVDVFRKLVT